MAGVVETLYVKSLGFNSATYTGGGTGGLGGPLRARIEHTGQPVKDRTGTDKYPTSVVMVDQDCVVYASLRDIATDIPIGTKDSLVLVYQTAAGADRTLTIVTMVYAGLTNSQDRATPGEAEHTWHHESAAGTADPITES